MRLTAGVLVSVTAMAIAAAFPARRLLATPDLPPINATAECDTDCSICTGEWGHMNALVNIEFAHNTGTIHDCGESSDCRYHNGCGPDLLSAVQEVWDAARANDVRALKLSLQRHKDIISVNKLRSAIQIFDCKKTGLIAHVPLPEATTKAVLE